MPALRYLFVLLFLAFTVLSPSGTQAQEPARQATAVQQPGEQLDEIRKVLTEQQARLQEPDIDEKILLDIRAALNPLRPRLDDIILGATPEIARIDARIAELGSPPADGAPPESAEVSAERAALTTARQSADELLRRARLLAVEVNEAIEKTMQLRRDLLTGRLFERRPSLVSPQLWLPTIESFPDHLANMAKIIADTSTHWQRRFDTRRGLVLAGCLLAALLLLGPGRIWAKVAGQRLAVAQAPAHRLRRSLNAVWMLLATAAAPTMAAIIALTGLRFSNLLPEKIDPLALVIVFAIGFIAIIDGLARGILSPGNASWRLAPVSDEYAKRIRRQVHLISTVYALGLIVTVLNQVVVTNAEASLITSGIFALANAITFAIVLRALRKAAPEDDEGTSTASSGSPVVNLLRMLAWIAIAAIIASVLTGFIAFGKFLTNQVIWIAIIASVLYLLLNLFDDLFTVGFSPVSGFGRWLQHTTGLRKGALEQIGVLLSGVFKLALYIIAILLVVAPWGIESYNATSWMRALIFGFSIGSYQLSLSAIIGGILILVVGIAATRLFQRWLDQRYMPKTSLDPGLQNSIRTGIGYFGVILAGIFALSSMGLNLENVAIVAGALSVGIGFGLQSIVNNFVSGLILLAERPVKVGDWVQLGTTEGNIRKISVRATEIELFDRSTLIVPNADLISSQVTNKTHTNPLGRVQISIGVGYGADPEQVRDILLATASAHDEVLADPAPLVLFSGFGESSLDFLMFVYVATPRRVGLVRSDLHFAIFKAFAEAKIEIPFPQRDINLRTSEGLEEVLKVLTQRAPLNPRPEN